MKFRLHEPTLKLLDGLQGVELGAAAHNPFGVAAINIAPALPSEAYHDQAQMGLCGEVAPIDLRGHAADMPLEDDSQDFVLSSHVLEHAPDLLRAFLEMARVVRPGGYIVMILPQPNALPGDDRPETDVSDIWRAYNEGWTWDTAPEGYAFGGSAGHYWKLGCDTLKGFIVSLFRKNSRRNWPGLKWALIDVENPDSKVGNGYWLAYQVRG